MNLLGEKVFRLTHFRCRKRCCRLCGLASPRNAAIFWLGWCFLWSTLCMDLWLAVFSALPPMWESVCCFLLVTAGVLVWLGVAAMLGLTYQGWVSRYRRGRRNTWNFCWGEIAVVTAFVPRYSALVLTPCLWRAGKRGWATLAAVSSLVAIAGWSCWGLHPWLRWGSAWAAVIGLVAAVTAFPDRDRLHWRSWIPFGLLALEIAVMWSVYGGLQVRIREEEAALTRLTGRPVTLAAFWREQERGLQVDEDPVWRVFMAEKPLIGPFPESEPLLEYETIFADWLNALKQICARTPEPIGHNPGMSFMPWDIRLPELRAFLSGAQYFQIMTMLNSGDREAVLRYQKQMKRLRDWALEDCCLTSKGMACSVEVARLYALSYAVKTGILTQEDWDSLTAPEVNWAEVFADGLMDDAIQLRVESRREISNPVFPETDVAVQWRWEGGEVLGIKMMWGRDCLAGLSCIRRQMEALLTPAANGSSGTEALPPRCGWVIGSAARRLTRTIPYDIPEMEDWRRMARAAYRIDAMYRASGVLPEAPEFLAEPEYRSTLTGEPFRYEAGDLTGKRGTPFHGFRLSIAPPPNANEEMARAVTSCVFPVAYPDHVLVKQ